MEAHPRRWATEHRGAWIPWGLSAVLLAPSALWVVKDRSVWPWDPSFYGMGAVDLWQALATSPSRWLGEMMHVYAAKAPAIAWAGQLFVPLGRWMGSIEAGLLASVLLTHLATLVLVHRIGRRMDPSCGPATLGVLVIGAAPLFVGLSHSFLVEPLQALAVAYAYWVAAAASSSPPLRTLLHLIVVAVLGLTIKISTPAFMAIPWCVAACLAGRGLARPGGPRAGPRELALGAAAALLLALCAGWYLRNASSTLAFARLAATSDVALLYGTRDTMLRKAVYWLGAMRRTLLGPEAPWLLAAAALVCLVALGRRRAELRRPSPAVAVLGAAALVQIALVLAIVSRTINEDSRYLLALAPSLAVLGVAVGSMLRGRAAWGAIALALVVQWGLVHGRGLDLLPGGQRAYWEAAPDAAEPRMRAVAEVAQATCDGRTPGPVMMGVDYFWLNSWTLRFYSSKAHLDGRPLCAYGFLGLAEKDVEVAWQRLLDAAPSFFVSLDPAAMPQPADMLNQVSLPILRRVQGDPRFARMPLDSPVHVLLYRRVQAEPSAPPSAGGRGNGS